MKSWLIGLVGLVIADGPIVATSSPAWADGAIAIGCKPDGTLVWGYQLGVSSTDEAKTEALRRCQSMGSDCTKYRSILNGDGAWIALALGDHVRDRQCLPFGAYYADSREKAAQMALTNCQKAGGQQCTIEFNVQNAPTTTYRSVPGGGGGGIPYHSPFSNHCPSNTVDRGAAGCRPSY
jgi:hypothetical protein